jgi:hypothetical protein
MLLCTLLKFLKNKLESFHLNKILVKYEFLSLCFYNA